MSGKKHFVFDMSDWFQTQLTNAQQFVVESPTDMELVQRRMQEAIDQDLEAARERLVIAAAAVDGLTEATRGPQTELAGRLEQMIVETSRRAEAPTAPTAPTARGFANPDVDAEPWEDGPQTAEAARRWQHDAEVIRDLIVATLPHERYAPGRVAAIGIRLGSASEEAASGRHPAALVAFRNAFHELSTLRVELELMHVEWLTVRRQAAAIVMTVEDAMAGITTIPLRDAEGRALEGTAFDLDHWSHGDSAKVRTDVTRVSDELGDQSPDPSIERLRVIRDEVGPDLHRRWRAAIAAAEYEVYASQVRGNIADDVMVAIHETAGYLVDQWGYEHGDERGRVFGRLRHPNGNEIVVEVVASPDRAPTGQVRLLSYDYTAASEEVTAQRTREIIQALRAQHLPVSDAVAEPGLPELELLDIAGLIEPEETRQAMLPLHDTGRPTPRPGR